MFEKIEKEKIALLGLGSENLSLLFFLDKKYKNLDICICDFREKKDIIDKIRNLKNKHKIKWQNKEKFNKNLSSFSILFRSPGWPLSCPGIKEARKNKTKISSPMNFFFEFCPSENIIGVTGSKGKGTTASLIYETIKKSKKKCFLGGNIGIAPLSFIEKIKKDDWLVLELSSFQLEDLKHSPKIAVITNIYPEHLSPADPYNPNFHKNIKAYFRAKMKIASNKENEYLLVNKKLKEEIEKYKTKGKKIYFSASNTPSKLMGSYNQENIAAAEKVAEILNINKKDSDEAIKNFSNLEHRLEFVREIKGIPYYNNSFATTPESTILDLKSFSNNIILIAGGASKNSDFKNLAKETKKRVKLLILFPGQGSEEIKKELEKVKYPKNKIYLASSMKEAVQISRQRAEKKDTVLLSTACASFGLFKNYKERGKLFKKEVSKKI
jgi:UDP-N-acetylmuramoylalanine--D-glutamate ligase